MSMVIAGVMFNLWRKEAIKSHQAKKQHDNPLFTYCDSTDKRRLIGFLTACTVKQDPGAPRGRKELIPKARRQKGRISHREKRGRRGCHADGPCSTSRSSIVDVVVFFSLAHIDAAGGIGNYVVAEDAGKFLRFIRIDAKGERKILRL